MIHSISFGFIDDVYKENFIKNNIEILNDNPNFSVNNSMWFKYKINLPTSKNEIILINNKSSIKILNDGKVKVKFKEKDYGVYNIIKKIDNCYYLKK